MSSLSNQSVAKRGGKREGAGRKRLKLAGTLPKGLAQKLLAEAETEKNWRELRGDPDKWLRLAVEKYIWDRAEGKPVQFIGGADDRPLQVNVNIRRVGG
jgi:hypothetical protein